MRNLAVGLAAALGVAFSCAGCKSKDANEVKVGVSLPLSGALVSYGKDVMAGVRLRVDQINASGGIKGRKIALTVEDNRGDPTDTRSSIKKLTEVDGVVAIIGPITSTSALAAKMDADRAGVPLITPTATNDKVTENTRWVFRVIFTDSFQGGKVATYVCQTMGLKKAATLIDNNSDYSKGLAASFAKEFAALGGAVTASESYQQKDTDFGTQMDKIIKSGAEIIFVPGYPPEVPQIIKQAKVSGFKGLLCGGDGWDNAAVIDNAGDKIVDCVFSAPFYVEDNRPIVKEFVQAIQASSKKLPGSFEALGYDSVSLVAEAVGKAGTDRSAVAKALHELKDVEGVTGKITMGPKGDAVRPAFIKKVVRKGDGFAAKYVTTMNP
jgi:branched-chain amino acid transport system substrate-binding protein